MESYISFINQHWILSGLFLALLLAIILNEFLVSFLESDSLNTAKALDLINHEEALVVDTRNPNLFSEGHILGSLNIPLSIFDKKAVLLDKYKDRKMIIVCELGQSSRKGLAELKKKGFKAFSLSGGIAAWRAAGLPLTKH